MPFRLHLAFAIITAVALAITLRPSARHRYTFAMVEPSAEQLSHQPFVPLPDILPPQLKKLSAEQERGIFWKDSYRLWRKKGLPFQVDFYHIDNAFHFSPEI